MESLWYEKAKEPGPFFHLSLDSTPISDLMHPYLGMYQVPFFGYYGPNFPYGDMVCIVRGSAEHIRLPQEVARIIAEVPEMLEGSKPVKADRDPKFVPKQVRVPRVSGVRTHFIVSDISQLHPRKGNVLNLVDHAWVFKDWTQKRLFRDVPKCILPIAGFTEISQRGVKFGALRCEYMSMHTKGGALCISPNNHRVQIAPAAGVCKCWTVAIDTEAAEAVVSLQWLICSGSVPSAFNSSRTVQELCAQLPELHSVVGCEGHSYHTRHKAQQYLQNFEAAATAIKETCPELKVTANEVFQDTGARATESRWGNRAQAKSRYPRVGAFEIYFRGRKVFSKLEAGMWPSPESIAGKVRRILDGVQSASPERSQPVDPYRSGMPKRTSPQHHPKASPPDAPTNFRQRPQSQDEYARRHKTAKKEEGKRRTPSKSPLEGNRYTAPSDPELRLPDPGERPKTPGEFDNKRKRDRKLNEETPKEDPFPREKKEVTPPKYEAGFAEDRAKPATPEVQVESGRYTPPSDPVPPPEEAKASVAVVSQGPQTPPRHPPEVPAAEDERPVIPAGKHSPEADEASVPALSVPPEDGKEPAKTPSAEPAQETSDPAADGPHRDEEDLDELFPEQDVSQEIPVYLPLGEASEQEMPYENRSGEPEEIAVKSSNAALLQVRNSHFTVAPGEIVGLCLDFAACDQETAKVCILYISVNGKVRECIRFQVIYTSNPPEDEDDQEGDPQDGEYGEEQGEEEGPEDGEMPSYELVLPVGVKSSKVRNRQKIGYPNDDPEDITIEVASSDPEYMEVKEPEITIPSGDTGKIKLSFSEVETPGEKDLFLTITVKGELRETIQIKVKYVEED